MKPLIFTIIVKTPSIPSSPDKGRLRVQWVLPEYKNNRNDSGLLFKKCRQWHIFDA